MCIISLLLPVHWKISPVGHPTAYIGSAESLRDYLSRISEEEMFHHTSRPDSQWVVVEGTNVIFFFYRIASHLIGCRDKLPNSVIRNHKLRVLQNRNIKLLESSTGTTCAFCNVWQSTKNFQKIDQIFISKILPSFWHYFPKRLRHFLG